MSLLPLCPDPLLKLLSETFQAIPIRIPGEQYAPLGVIAKWESREKFLGTITNFLTDIAPFDKEPIVSPLASVSASRSRQVDFSLGFDIMNCFLRGMGLDGAQLKANFSGVRKVSFTFQDVQRKWMDIGVFGNFLKGKRIDPNNPANNLFLREKAACVVIDSTINCNNFSMHIEDAAGGNFHLDIPAIQNNVGQLKNDIKVSSSGALGISFQGTSSLAFAFSAITFALDDLGTIQFTPGKFTAYSGQASNQALPAPDFSNRVVFYDQAGMVEFD
jgi:hypothetical protein